MLGSPVKTNRLSSWIVSTISKAYSHFNLQLPQGVRGHSTRAVGASLAFQRGLTIEEVCRAATWANGLADSFIGWTRFLRALCCPTQS